MQAIVIFVRLSAMHPDVGRVLIPQERIAQRVIEMARQISADHAASGIAGELTLIPILTGAMIFCADLMRQMPMAMRIGMCTVSSYPGRSVASQGPQLLTQQLGDLRGHHVLLIDDVLDSGNTLRLVAPLLRAMEPATLRLCVLLRKDRPSARDVKVDYVGFDIPDAFVVGYGLDFNDRYRNLPNIVTLRDDLIKGPV